MAVGFVGFTARCLAPLLRKAGEDVSLLADQSLAVTLRCDGKITVSGGNVRMVARLNGA